jgi:serine/threonine protein kinase/tetratricopeptide (TPR) repeat protein
VHQHLTALTAASAATPTPPPTSIASLVAQVADDFLDRLARGEAPEISDYARRYPQIASVLPLVLPAVRMIHEMDPNDAAPLAASTMTGPLGEFRLLREIGRGGMGVVYEAEQTSLGRRVALKVLAATPGTDAKQLARFQIEAQVAAALNHPHIVPIFAVGCDRGVHYYAMQLIEGRCLAKLLWDAEPRPGKGATDGQRGDEGTQKSPRSPVSPQDAARLAMQAAEALEHAHGLGVLHRDIKPGNLLVDGRGHLWIADFGLARFQDAGNLTLSGDLLGTLRYMSPEQAAGGRILDPRTDIYSLGATLYELLTARPAFDGADRQELLRQISQVEPTPPRKLDSTIPPDLETIVAKAMAKEPCERYATARELALDLERFLTNRPILARRPGLGQHVARWSQRHWRATTAAAAFFLSAALASASGMALFWQAQQRAQQALLTAQAARLRERQALHFTFAASDEVADRAFRQLASPKLPRNPAEERHDQAFCRKALGYYQEIAAQYCRDPEMQSIVAAAEHRVGFILMILKEPGAEEAHRRAIALYRRVLAASPGDCDLRLALGLTYSDLIFLLQANGQADAALDCFPPLLALRRGIAADFPAQKVNRISLVYLEAEYGNRLEDAGRPREAEEVRRRLEQSHLVTLASEPNDPIPRNALAWLLASRPDAPPHDPARAVSLAREAVALAPADGAYWNTAGVAHYRAGNAQAAAAALEESMRLRSGGDAYDWLFLAMVRVRLGDRADARRWYDRSVKWIETNAPHDQELLRFRAEAARRLEPEGPPAPKPGGDRRLTK